MRDTRSQPGIEPRSSDGGHDAADTLSSAGSARRRFLLESGALTGSLAAAPGASALAASDAAEPARMHTHDSRVRLQVNGRSYDLALDPRVTLLDALREHIGLTGTKKGCDRGQ